ncbi:MAG: putative succinate-semialdehyde dehydrogenase [NADP(+)] 2 [Acidimicrobiales bacterium]|nr:MAG: succinate-semialdehyde dehydrogenase (NADP(+)) [Actinomycetota bacterium]MBV6508656.1 putative succinate-semialdehyde dehydrogenase [NADP(+)] 2 [Acidimicrobiales bacterium]RIK08100.1 MAG: succinic semialdehyde dehydrogenase [Acidobacteriota bacterium]
MSTQPDVAWQQSRADSEPMLSERIDPAMLERLASRVTLADPDRAGTTVHTPLTDAVIGRVPDGQPDDVIEAVRRARAAQQDWAQRSFGDRGAVLVRFHDLVLERQDEVLDLIQLESGKARAHAFEEVADAAIVARYYAHHSEKHLRPRRRQGALPLLTTTTEYRHPKGVVGFIAPWNYPLSMSITDALPALMAGNGVVLKPDAMTPFTALWAVELLTEAGLPRELFGVVSGRGTVIGTPMIENVDFICFTGSTRTGRIIGSQAGEQLIACSLELGGKNPMIVLDDADLDAAADGAVRGCFASAGQLCISIERLFVQAGAFDGFVERFVERVGRIRLGAGLDWEADMGSLVSAEQFATVSKHVDDAMDKGATVLAGGRARPDVGPHFYEPTVLAGVTEDMTVYREETFGPVVSVYGFEDIDEVIGRANASPYGLNGSIWTGNTARGREIATRLQVGTVNVNEAYAASYASVDAPMGGFKDSGLGRRHGAEGIRKYTEPQTVSVQRLMPIAAPDGLGERRYASVMTKALGVLRRLPGVR